MRVLGIFALALALSFAAAAPAAAAQSPSTRGPEVEFSHQCYWSPQAGQMVCP